MLDIWKTNLVRKWAFLAAALIVCVRASAEPKQNVEIVILHTNDVHGHVWPFKNSDGKLVGGYAAQANMIQALRDESVKRGAATLVLSGGDVNIGVPESDYFKGEPDVVSMNHIAYDAMVLGNHDFDGGVEKIFFQKKIATFPMLVANVTLEDKSGRKLAEPYRIVTKNGLKFGIVALTTDSLGKLILPEFAKPLRIQNPSAIAKKLIPEVKRKSDVLIALTHIGILAGEPGHEHKKGYVDDIQLAKENPEFDLIIGGHSHTVLPAGYVEGNTLIAQAGEKGKHLGKVTALWEASNRKVSNKKAEVLPVNPEKGTDSALATKVAAFLKKGEKVFDAEVGEALVFLDGKRETARHRESNLGNLVCDAIKDAAQADAAIFNGGGIRESVDKGKIRYRDILRALPFRNHLVVLRMTGAQLRQTLSEGIENSDTTGSFLQVSGLSYEIKDGKLGQVKLGKKLLGDSDKISVATDDFIATGGDGFTAVAKAKLQPGVKVQLIDKIVADFIKKKGKVSPQVEGRILLVSSGS